MAQSTQIRQIRIQIDTKGDQNLKAIADKLGGVNKSVKSLSSSFGLLKNAFLGYFSALGLGELIRMSDTMQLLNSRIAVLSGGTEQAKVVMDGLLQTANRTKASIDGLSEIYSRLSASTKETGVSTQTLLDLTEVLQNSFRLSGAGAQEANSAAIQLSQGFASGQLRGQELRSTLEANVVIGDLLSKTFGVTRGELYKLAEAGQLTASKVMVALLQNMNNVNGQAAKLGQTFEQTVTVSMNNFKVKLLEINQEFDLSGKFAKGMEVLTEKIGLIGVMAVLVATTQLPLLIKGIQMLTTTARAFAVSNPYVLIFTAIATAIVLAFDNLKEFMDYLKFTYQEIMKFFNSIGQFFAKLDMRFAKTPQQLARAKASLESLQKSYNERNAKQDALFAPSEEELKKQEEARKAALQREKDLEKLRNMGGTGKEKKMKELYSDLNTAFLKGRISIDEYYASLQNLDMEKITRDFRDGKITLDKYNLALEEVKKKNIQREFQEGAMTLDQFNAAIARVNLAELDIKFRAGQLTLQEYKKELYAIKAELSIGGAMQKGIFDFVESLGTVGTDVANATKAAFSSLEESLNNFIKTGSMDFKNFAQGILDDIQKIIIRAQIIRPLANGILGAFGGGAAAGASAGGSYVDYGNYAAKGMAFDGGVRMFAKGGIVNKPTMFSFNGGTPGMMGEAGTEAILPLTRGSNGDLGVQAQTSPTYINIINNGGGEVETRERQGTDGKIIDVIINRKVQEGLANGSFDKAMGAAYGLKRRGN